MHTGFLGVPWEGTLARKQEARTGQRHKLTCNELAAEVPAGMPGAVVALQSVPAAGRERGLCSSKAVRHWPLAAPG